MGTYILRHGMISKLLLSDEFYEMEPGFTEIQEEAKAAHTKIEADLKKLKEGKCAKCVERGIRKKELEMVKAHAAMFSKVVMYYVKGFDTSVDGPYGPPPHDFSGMKTHILKHFNEFSNGQTAPDVIDTIVLFMVSTDESTGAVNHIKMEV